MLRQVLSITSRGLVCLDQLISAQKNNNGRFGINALPREALVCDMEKMTNIRKSIKYASHYYFH